MVYIYIWYTPIDIHRQLLHMSQLPTAIKQLFDQRWRSFMSAQVGASYQDLRRNVGILGWPTLW
jgi:hypothetical protein